MNEKSTNLNEKLTWKKIYADFKSRHPNLRKKVMYWCPHGYEMIQIYLDDGSKGTYNYYTKEFKFIRDRWIKNDD